MRRSGEDKKGMRAYSDVIIIGAGAAGLFCAGLLAQEGKSDKDFPPLSVTIFEKNDRIGKKLSATGNGRCNFTNLHMSTDCYYGDNGWMENVLGRVTPQKVIDQFAIMGVLHRERDGYVYPHTNQAGTVIRALEQACRAEQIHMELDCLVKGIYWKSKKEGFEVTTSRGTMSCRILVVASGSAASKELGGDTSGYEMLQRLRLHVGNIYPGLTGLRCPGKWWKQVAGTRIQGTFSLLVDGEEKRGETGEIQIVKDGVSGIPVFQLCRVAAEALDQGKRVRGIIDFVPALSKEKLQKWSGEHGIQGLVPEKWLPVLETRDVSCLKNYTFDVADTFGLERAQVAAGGVELSQVDPTSMEVRQMPNLFLLGEILDVDGKCGGYNLHFAWATAMLAAETIAGRVKDSDTPWIPGNISNVN